MLGSIFRLTVYAVFSSLAAFALEPGRVLHEYKLDVFDSSAGLIPHEISGIVQAPPGFLWAATTNGLLRFDGARILRIPSRGIPGLKSKVLVMIGVARDGTLWFTPAGPGLFSYKDGQFQRATPEQGLPANTEVYGFGLARRSWFGTRDGHIYEFRDGRFHLLAASEKLPRSGIRNLFEDTDGALWVALDSGLFRIHGDQVRQYGAAEGNPIVRVFAVNRTRAGVLFAGGIGGVVRLRGERFERVVHPKLDANAQVQEFLVDRNDHVWISTDGGGVLRVRGDKIESLDKSTGLPDNTTINLIEDTEGSVWIQTRAGLVRLRDAPIEPLALRSPEFASGGRIMQDLTGTLWLGSNSGRLLGVSPSGSLVKVPTPQDSSTILSLMSTRQGLWVGRERGSLQILKDGKLQTVMSPGKPISSGGFRLATTRNGDVLIGTRREGLWLLPRGEPTGLPQRLSLDEPGITSLLVDSAATIWAGTRNGLYRRRATESSFAKVPLEGLPGLITALADSKDGALWIGTPNGLGRLRGGSLQTFSDLNGLDDSTIIGILESAGELWLADGVGLCSIPLDQFDEAAHDLRHKLAPRRYTETDGLPTRYIRPLAHPLLIPLQDGRIAVATDRGPAIIDSRRLQRAVPAPRVFLDEVRVNGERVAARPVVVPPGAARVEFTYTGLTLAPDFAPVFRYRLSGLQAAWETAGRARQAVFTNLPPGTYSLEIASADRAGRWGPSTRVADVIVEGYLYQSPWFWAALILIASVLALLGHRLRTQALEREVELVAGERNRIARELHDTVLQGFVSVVPTLSTLAASVPDTAEQSRAREAIRLMESSLADARRTIRGLRSPVFRNRSLCSVIQEFAERLSRQAGMELKFSAPELPVLDAGVEENIYRIAAEALRNTFRHSRARTLEVSFQVSSHELVMAICDDGIGFDPDTVVAAQHFGITGMRERAAQIGATLLVQPKAERGTSLILSVPLQQSPA